MLNLLKALRQDEHGVILSAEIVIVGTVLVIGVMTGLACLQKSVNSELGDFAKAIDSIDQSYSFSGHRLSCSYNRRGNCCAYTAGSSFRNNECNPNACQTDIVGCEGQVMLHSGNCGNGCGTCGSCGNQCGAGGVCGSCGWSGNGSADPCRPNCLSTGVPNFRASEYPGTSNVPRTSNEGRSPIRFPELEAVPQGHEFFNEPGHMGPGPGHVMEHHIPMNPEHVQGQPLYPHEGLGGPPHGHHEGHQHNPNGPVPGQPAEDGPDDQILPVPQNQSLPPMPDNANPE